ncbi:MAG: NAD(P)/FAD-dependent oxidoreductase [Desulfobacterales bacterium]|nr:NAD(P)/FAD-dependent oxidoreductase [Desulfobacterales bacterium]
MTAYDAIVIGAGNGGLTAAATLAKSGVRVLLLERHNIPGGCATSFCRGRFEFEVALHQLSGLGTPEKPGPLRSTLGQVGVLDKLDFVPMTDLYRLVIPDVIDITLKPDLKDVIETLQARFPHEKDGIAGYFQLMYDFFTQVIGVFYMRDPDASREKYPLYYRYALKTTQEAMDEFIRDPLLQAVISPYWTYIGLPPEKMAFADMAAMFFAYIEFVPYHLKGGSQSLSNAIADVILSHGGRIRYNCGVKRILVEDGRALGVVTDNGEEIMADAIISNASKLTTYVDLLDREAVPESVFAEMRQSSLSQSAFTIYMGLDATPEQLGLTQSTNFILPGSDTNQAFERMKHLDINDDDAMILSCYTLVDPSFSPPGTTQAALVTLKYGEPWLNLPPAQYASEKFRVAENMLKVAEKSFPGLRDHMEEMEIATPVTHLRYLGHPRGAIYGFEKYLKDSTLFIPNRSPIENLFLTGGSVGLCGFQPTLDSGVSTARIVKRKLAAKGGK